MKILLLQVERTQERWLDEGFSVYAKRLTAYVTFEVHTVNAPKDLRQRSEREQKEGEEKLLMKIIKPEDHVALLDERGKTMTSEEFAEFISGRASRSIKRLVFVVGGPFGFSDGMYARAQEKISMSKMTFSHQMVRVFFAEQLYRAYTIIRGERYHHK